MGEIHPFSGTLGQESVTQSGTYPIGTVLEMLNQALQGEEQQLSELELFSLKEVLSAVPSFSFQQVKQRFDAIESIKGYSEPLLEEYMRNLIGGQQVQEWVNRYTQAFRNMKSFTYGVKSKSFTSSKHDTFVKCVLLILLTTP